MSELPRLDSRRFQDPWDPDRGIVDEVSVRALAMLSERLAVIGGDADDQVVPHPAATKGVEEAIELAVDRRHFGGIGTRNVRRMRLEEMYPQKEGLASGAHPALGAVECLARAAFGCAAHLVVVGIETAIQAVAAIEHDGADERTSRIAARLQPCRVGCRFRSQRENLVVANAVRRGVGSGEQRRVGRQRHRRDGHRRVESDGLARHAVERRRDRRIDVIRAQGVDGDDDHRPWRWSRRRRLLARGERKRRSK